MQQPNLQQIFQRVDTDRSGQISVNELQRALSNGTWAPFNPETCRLMIGMFDSNGDGAINFTEFQALWNYVNEWTKCFRSFDRDNSGAIDHGELSQALNQFGYRLSPVFVNLLVQKFDRTKSNSVMFDDFIQLCVVLQTLTAAFRDKDSDRDGIISVGYEEFLTMVFSTKIFQFNDVYVRIPESTLNASDVLGIQQASIIFFFPRRACNSVLTGVSPM
ncbi:hypothetical protein L596_007802 [Steinernema carpocapsae]|uniref:EF-hand domain-containing protein n=1 Tax=Steinernema carpocapsae TaxID=34508 RepID=A0A4U5PBI1_STECR|nr:hypothetical protein L596_007802 [Steinernema carpocapsae]